ncbi:MAG: PEGA domain-containing protein [Myxococcales bacterium]|nr:PEGA domain-containing protein [Myxococcales bacterium]
MAGAGAGGGGDRRDRRRRARPRRRQRTIDAGRRHPDAGRPDAGPDAAATDRRAASPSRRAGRDRLLGDVPAPRIRLDGVDAAITAGRAQVTLPPGPHELVVSARGHVEQRRTIEVIAGQAQRPELTLERARAGKPAAARGPARSTTARAWSTRSRSLMRAGLGARRAGGRGRGGRRAAGRADARRSRRG